MVVDCHTHVFPPRVRQRREEYLRRDRTFAEMYSSAKARLATAEELLTSMEEAEVEASIVLGFAWSEHELCVEHNDYLLEAAVKSGGRLIPFCTLQPRAGEAAFEEAARCASGGARGLGELRPESQGYRLDGSDAGALLAETGRRHGFVLLYHVSEPVGHSYPGKAGLSLQSFYQFADVHDDLTLVGSHWGGGLPFHALMPEVREVLSRVYVDTAATPYLYDAPVYRLGCLAGAERILFGSDFPLISQRRQREAIEEGLADDEAARRLVLGENACRMLGLGSL
jgi:predicted TIM-barrel fold metal-dependent hydrolase